MKSAANVGPTTYSSPTGTPPANHTGRRSRLHPLSVFFSALTLILVFAALAAASADANGDLVVMKGGDRTATNSAQGSPNYATPVEGALFEYTQGNPTLPATLWTAFSATTGVNGQATESLPAGIYYVREKTAGPGFTNYGPVHNLNHSGLQPYVARVQVENNQTTYSYPHTNTDSNPSNWSPTRDGNSSNNGSPFINARDNEDFPPNCGTNILLVLDRSGSIDPYKNTYKAAAQAFVNQLNGTPTQIGIISFNADVNSYSPATGNSSFYHSPLDLSVAGNAATLNATIDDIYNSPNDLTNWDGVLNAASQAKGFTPNVNTGQSANPDVVAFITDGNPTTDEVNDTSTSLIELTSGMASANKVKNQAGRPGYKTKMLAIGVGNGVTPANLKAVSGPIEGVDGDYATPTVAELQSFLSELAAAQCGGRVYIRKHLEGDATNQSAWGYTADDPRQGFSASYLDDDRFTHASGNPPVIETGAFFSQLPNTPTTVTINEDANGQPIGNFDLTDVDCRFDAYDGAQAAQGNLNGLSYSLDLDRGDAVYCTFTNSPRTTLEVTKSPDDQTINAGEDAEFTIAVENTGSNTAISAALSDQLPAPGSGAWTVSQQPAGGNCSVDGSNLLTCAFGDIPAGQTRTLKVKTTTSFSNCDVYDNPAATASAANANPVDDAGKITCDKPDLSIDKTPDAQNINAGENVVFTIQVDNAGPGTAKDVQLSDNLPGGVAGAWVEDPDNTDCTITGGNQLDCDFGDLTSGASKTVTVKAPTDAQNCATYDNTADLTSTNAPDDSDDGQVTCQPPGLGVIKTAVQGTINAGEDAVFDITVTNTGTGTATGVTLSDPLPAGVSGDWVVSGADAGDCVSPIVGNTLDCDFGDLPAGQSRTVTVTAPTDFDNCTTLDNTATASSTNAPDDSDDAQITCDKPNLTLDKTPDAQNISAGEDVVFDITVSNGGPGTAKAVTLADNLPGPVSGIWSVSGADSGDCVSPIAGGTLDCSFGDLAAGASKTVTVTAATTYEDCTTYDNTATASSTNAPDAGDDGQVTCDKPDLSIDKTPDAQNINAGENVVFTIQVDNAGPGTAKDVQLSDNLPGGVAGAWVEDPDNTDCTITGGNQLDCDFGDLTSGASKTVTVKAPTDAQNCATYDNTADLTSTNAPDDSDDGQVTCQPPGLGVIKTAVQGTINAGEDAVFDITVTNTGTGTATGVTLSDPLPAGVSGDWVVSGADAGDCVSPIVGNTLDCDFGDLPAGQSRTVTVTAPTDFDNCTTLDNTATASSTNAPDDSDDAQITCDKPNLTLDKTPDAQNISAGEDVVFDITVSNGGPGTAKAVTLADNLPGPVSGIWSVSGADSGDCVSPIAGGTLDCSFGDLAAGASKTVTVTAATTYEDCTTYDNTATASSTNAPDAGDDGQVTCDKPDLSIEKTGNGTINAGENVIFDITVSNGGPGTATSVSLNDLLPQGTAGPWAITTQPGGDPCSITDPTLNCDFGDLGSGESRTVTVSAPTEYENCTTYDNTATAASTNAPDADDSAVVTCDRPGLGTLKTAVRGTIDAGDTAEFSIEVTNVGPGVAKAVTLNDPLPGPVTGNWTIDSQPNGNPCSIANGTLSCDFGDLGPGDIRTVVVSAQTDFEHCAQLDNSAVASAANSPDAEDEATINCRKPDLSVVKTGNGTINAGENVVFDVTVANAGPGTAKAVTLSDPLPGGVSGDWVVSGADAGDCVSPIVGNTLDCDFGDLAAEASKTVTVTAATDVENCTTYDNTATASSTNGPDANGQASVLCQEPNLIVTKTGNGKVKAGEDVSFTITVENQGPGLAKSQTLQDSLPKGTAGPWAITTQPGGDPCSITDGLLTCSFGDVPAGESRTVKVKAPTGINRCASYENTATAFAENALEASDDATVDCSQIKPRLVLKKTGNKKKAKPGAKVRYKITVKNTRKGSVAKNLKVCDRVPRLMTVVSKGNGFFQDGKLCWKIKKLPYSKKGKTLSYVTRIAGNAKNGARLKNVVILGKLKASHTVKVVAPEVQVIDRRPTPVTG